MLEKLRLVSINNNINLFTDRIQLKSFANDVIEFQCQNKYLDYE